MFVSSKTHAETLAHNVVVSGGGGLWEVIRVKLGNEGGAPIMKLVPHKMRKKLEPSLCHVRK